MADAFGPTLDGSVNFAGAILKSFYLRRRIKRWTRKDLLQWQQKRLQWLVKWAYTNSAFYRKLYDEAGVNIHNFELEDLPLVNKQMLMDNFDEVMTTPEITEREIKEFCEARRRNEIPYGHFKGRYLPIKSSGSTGEKGLFIFDKAYFRRMFATMAAHRSETFMPRGLLHMSLAALFSPDEFHLATTTFPRLTPLGIKAVFIPASADLTDINKSLNEAQPDVLAGFPSLIQALCGEAVDGRLHISPARVCCTGESLDPRTQSLIEKTFGCTVYNLYACAEANPIGMTHIAGKPYLKLIEDFAILEPVDAETKAVPAGQVSHGCLLTNLHSTVMPIIRYKMNDQIKFLDGQADQNSIFTIMDNVGGRRPIMIRMQDRRNKEVLIQPLSLIDLLAEDPDVRAVQIQQKEIGKIRILATLAAGAYEAGAKERISKTVGDYLVSRDIEVSENNVRLELMDRIPPDPTSGKVHGFVSSAAINPIHQKEELS